MIPPVYILTTLLFGDLRSRARAFGVISGMGGIGAAAGPLIGGVITTAISWRAAFLFQAIIIVVIFVLSRRHRRSRRPPTRPVRSTRPARSCRASALCSSCWASPGRVNLWRTVGLGRRRCVVPGVVLRPHPRAGTAHKEPLLSTGLFRNHISNLGLVTQNLQWLLLMGTAFVVSAYLQVIRGYNAIQTGVIFTAATAGILVSSLAAERLAKKYAQRSLIIAGFIATLAGIALLLAFVKGSPNVWAFAPGLFLIGLGLGTMLTPSVNVVQSSFAEELQGEISGLSRSVSNLGLVTRDRGRRHDPRRRPHHRRSGPTPSPWWSSPSLGLIGLVVAFRLPPNPAVPSRSIAPLATH